MRTRRLYLFFFSAFMLCFSVRSQELIINEVLISNTSLPDASGGQLGWIEIYNASQFVVFADHYYISNDSLNLRKWRLPSREIQPGEFLLIWNSDADPNGPSLNFSLDQTRYLLMYNSEASFLADVFLMSPPPLPGESIGRVKPGASTLRHYQPSFVTPGKPNSTIGPWMKVTERAAFGPRDSSPNALLSFKNKLWILAGYRREQAGYVSRSDIWVTSEGTNWELVKSDPPYNPYSAYIVFNGKMWAFDGDTWASQDGLNWTQMASGNYPLGLSSRIVEFNGKIWATKSNLVYYSTDGLNWVKATDSAPWSSEMTWPGFVAFDNKMWVLGGGAFYRTGYDLYFNDVWSSEDGINWELVQDDAPWAGRYWHCVNVYDGRMWMFGGFNIWNLDDGFGGQQNDVWISDNGRDWMRFKSEQMWQHRHASFTTLHDGKLWMIGGGADNILYGDVWTLEGGLFFSKPDGDLTDPLNWAKRFDGSGAQPSSFLDENQIFVLCNRDTAVLDHEWKIGGAGSQLHVGDGVRPLTFVVSRNASIDGLVNISNYGTLEMRGEVSRFGRVDSASKVVIKRQYGDEAINIDFNSQFLRAYGGNDGVLASEGKGFRILSPGKSSLTVQNLEGDTLTTFDVSISKRPLTIVTPDTTKIFGSENPKFSIRFEGLLPGDLPDSIDKLPTPTALPDRYSPVGQYEIIFDVGSDNNYDIITKAGIFTILKRPLMVAALDTVRMFGHENPVFTLTFEGLLPGDVPDSIDMWPTATSSAERYSRAGRYEINLSGGVDNNYEIIAKTSQLTILPSEQIFTLFPNPADNKVIIYDSEAKLTKEAKYSTEVRLYSSSGKLLLRAPMGNECEVDLSGLERGVYIIKIVSENRSVFVTKVVKS